MTTASTPLPDTAGPMAAVRDYITAFNKRRRERYGRDVLVEGEHLGAADYFVELGDPRHVNVTGDNAYVVVPTIMTFKLQGKQITQTGATFIVALRKLGDAWRIAAWAWAKGTAQQA